MYSRKIRNLFLLFLIFGTHAFSSNSAPEYDARTDLQFAKNLANGGVELGEGLAEEELNWSGAEVGPILKKKAECGANGGTIRTLRIQLELEI